MQRHKGRFLAGSVLTYKWLIAITIPQCKKFQHSSACELVFYILSGSSKMWKIDEKSCSLF